MGKFQNSDRVVRTDGKEQGREATVVYVYNEEQMKIRYCDAGKRTYDVRSKHYILASEWKKSRPLRSYQPKRSTIERIKAIIADSAFELSGKRYVAHMSHLTHREIELLVEKGFLRQVGRVGSLFPNTSHWEIWFNKEIRAGGRPFHYNAMAYQALKDIDQFEG